MSAFIYLIDTIRWVNGWQATLLTNLKWQVTVWQVSITTDYIDLECLSGLQYFALPVWQLDWQCHMRVSDPPVLLAE